MTATQIPLALNKKFFLASMGESIYDKMEVPSFAWNNIYKRGSNKMLVNIHDAKTNFSKLINRVLKGDEIIIAKDGHPVVRLVPYTETINERHGGQLKGLMEISDNFDAPLPDDLLKQFYQDKK